MWYLLVAAGAGYLAQRWQNTHKSRRPLLPGKCQNQRPSPPTSAPATPKRSSFSSSAVNDSDAVQNANTSSNGSGDKEKISVDCKAPPSCFVSGSTEDNIPYQLQVSKLPPGSPQGLKSNKRSACEAFLVPVPDTFKSTQGNTKDQIVSNPSPNLNFANIKENIQDQFVSNSRPSLEFANIQLSTKDQSVFTSKPTVGSANIQGNAKGHVVFTSKPNLDFVNIANKEQLQGDSTSPSSCCSSSSTVLNSPLGTKPIQQKLGTLQNQGKERRREINICEQSSTQNHVAESPSLLENGALKGRAQGVVFSASKYNCYEAKALQHSSPWRCEEGLSNSMIVGPRSNIDAATSFNAPVFTGDNGMLNASTHRPYVFTGENQRGITRTDLFSNELMCNDKLKLEMKQGTISTASDTNFPRKVKSLISPSHTVATESACDSESESLVSFGLAMAVFCMVSSSKREMEKMGKVLKETEDLVTDMRKELEERRVQSYVSCQTLSDNECNDKLLTIKSKDAVTQVCTLEKTDFQIDNLCQVSDDESIRSVITEEHTQYELQMCDLKAGEDKLQFVEINLEDYSDNGKQNQDCDSEDEKDSLTLEETGEDDYVLSMLELERKLWKIFQQRQEEKILELEESLEMALSKLHAKEEELRWWKNRASWLMEHSFGSTSGAISKDREGFNRTDETRFSIKGCDVGEKITRKLSTGDANNREFSAGETSFLALEEECTEIVGNEDGPKNTSGHQNLMVRVGSACSISSEESVLSFDVRTFTYPEYTRSIPHS